MGFAADTRAALKAILTAAASASGTKMQIYDARPQSLHPPTGFVDVIPEVHDNQTNLPRREADPHIIAVFGTYDLSDTAHQRDAFIDALVAYVSANPHAISPNSMIGVGDIEDLPEFVPTWLQPPFQTTYYATRIGLEGFRRGV